MESSDVRRHWAERSGEYSPAYYAHYGADETSEQLRTILDRFVNRDAHVLELGCSSGRHLAHLSDHGFENLSGVDLNPDAFDVMADEYPELAAMGTFHVDAIEDVVVDVDDGQFDAVYSVETLQHVHPDADWVFEEIARITDDLLVTVENEGDGSVGEEAGGDGTGEEGGGGTRGNWTGEDTERGVNYVDEGVPLYYRDWNQIFTQRGFVEVAVDSGGRDTVRTFRAAGE